jgi:hypothetical protein
MRSAILKCLAAGGFIACLVMAIGHTDNASPWLVAWFLLFFFVGLPLGLLSIRDLLVAFFSSASASFRAWLLLHVCATFAACIGCLLGHMARASGHPKADLHQWLALVLPALVYLTPVLLALHSGSLGFLSVLARAFRRNPNDEA